MVVIAAAAGGIAWMRSRATTQSPPAAAAGQEQASLTDVYVTNQVELARADLANRDYEAAARRAEDALKLKPASAEARAVLDQARAVLGQIAEAVAQARGAFGRGDVDGASSALGRVMALDPRQPVIGELSAALKQHLRPQAEDGRRQAETARRAADQARATALAGFTQGRRLTAEADGLFRRQDYAAAAQKYLESRNAFERAKREADEARTAALRPSPSALPTLVPAPSTPSPVALTAAPTPAPTVSPTVVFVPPPPTAPAVPPSAPAAVPATPRPVESEKAEVQRVIAEYGRALENRDVALYRALIPGLSPDGEKRLREAFKAYKPQRVGITVDSVQVEGDRATVRATRQDVIEGRATKAVSQTFQLVRAGTAWQIQSIGQ